MGLGKIGDNRMDFNYVEESELTGLTVSCIGEAEGRVKAHVLA